MEVCFRHGIKKINIIANSNNYDLSIYAILRSRKNIIARYNLRIRTLSSNSFVKKSNLRDLFGKNCKKRVISKSQNCEIINVMIDR